MGDCLYEAVFYEAVFGWKMRGDPDEPSFEDGSGHVIGHSWRTCRSQARRGVRLYIFVEHVDETLDKVAAHSGEVVTAPYPEGDPWVATFRDPAGNVLGVLQTVSRDSGGSSWA